MRDSNTERIGVFTTGLVFTKDLKWIFREQPIVDVGIDALVEEVKSGNPTGKFIAVQIKTGEGNFHSKNDSLVLYVSKIHYNYWLNTNIPIIVVAHIPENDLTTWEHISDKTLQKTKTQWKLEIPKSKLLSEKSIEELSKIIQSEIQDDFEHRLLKNEVSAEEIYEIEKDFSFFKNSVTNLISISNYLEKMNVGTARSRKQIDHFAEIGLDEFDKRVKKNVKTYATLMMQTAWKLNAEIEDFAQNFSKGIRAYEKACIATFHMNQDYLLLQEIKDSLEGIRPNTLASIEAVKDMRNSASALPTKYSQLKKSRLKFIEISNQIIVEFKLSDEIVLSLINNLEEKLG